MPETSARRPSYSGALASAIVAVLLLLFVYTVAEVLLLLFVAALLGVYLGAATDVLERRLRIPRPLGMALAVVLTTAAVVGVAYLIVPPVLEQTQELLNTLPDLLIRWREGLLHLSTRYPVVDRVLPSPDDMLRSVEAMLANLGGYLAQVFPYVFSGISFLIHLISVVVMAVYLALRPDLYREGVVLLFPPVHRDLVRSIFADLGATLRAWIVGQILAMIVLGTLTWIGLLLLDVPYALAFGVFTGVAVLVPFFGTLVSTLLPALFVLGSGGVVQALLVVLLGLLVHLFEANFVHPLIMERQINLPPVLSIISVLVMGELLGAAGLPVAVPALATLLVVIRRVYIHRMLEGRGFRRFVRDAPVEVALTEGMGWAHTAGRIDMVGVVERLAPGRGERVTS